MWNPVRNDWILTVWEDFEELDIALDIETISTLSIGCYRKFLFKKIEDRVLHYLNEMKSKHSKVMHLKHEILKLQNYLLPANQKDVQLSKFIFHAKTRMLKVRHNFKNNYVHKSKECPLGCGSEDTQEHLLFCSKIVESSVSTLNQPNYEDLFSEESLKQITIAAILQRRLNIRKGMIWC